MTNNIIKIHKSQYSPNEIDETYKFIQWIANIETIIAICEDLETGQIHQFKLNMYPMSFIYNKSDVYIDNTLFVCNAYNKDNTSAMNCTNCGKAKFLHTT